MCILVELPRVWEPPPVEPLDEAVWQAWVRKGRVNDRRSSAARMTGVKWVSAATLLAAAGFWSHLTPYEVLVRFIAAAGSMFMMFQAFHSRRYAFAAVFGALVLLYNPVAPAISLSGGWQRAVVLASAFPLFASLGWRNLRPAHNG